MKIDPNQFAGKMEAYAASGLRGVSSTGIDAGSTLERAILLGAASNYQRQKVELRSDIREEVVKELHM